MLRQIKNLIHFGRLRTAALTRRMKKPKLLKKRPELEVRSLLRYVTAAQHAKSGDNFFFVQIGAFDGHSGDALSELVLEHHWRGLLVEPQANAFEELQRKYANEKQVQLFNVAIGPTDGELTLYTRKSGDVSVASTQRHLLIKPGHGSNDVIAQTVPCWTLSTLLKNADAPREIDLLQIDTEGFDYEIIRSIDFTKIKPAIIRYEHALLSESDRNACLQLLADQGYRFILEDMDTSALLVESQRQRKAT